MISLHTTRRFSLPAVFTLLTLCSHSAQAQSAPAAQEPPAAPQSPAPPLPLAPPRPIVFTGAQLADGTGAPLRRANVRITGDTITRVGDFTPDPADQLIDASGLV